MISQKPDTDTRQSQQLLMLGSNVESGSMSSNSGNEAYWEGMPRSADKALIQLTILPSEDALIILHSLVELVADKSEFSSTSAKLKLLSSHKVVWTKLAQDLGISSSMAVTYTYIYLFNPSLAAMAKEVISERHKEVSIVVAQPDSTLTQMTLVSKIKKLAVSVAELNSYTHILEFSYDAIWREGITYKDATL